MNKIVTINNEKPKVEYIGINILLDEILKRIKEVKLIDYGYVDKYVDIYIKLYRELKEGK